MVDAARRNKRVVQAGSQQRSGAHYIQAVELIRSGRIGEVHRIEAGMQRNIFPGPEADGAAGRPDPGARLGYVARSGAGSARSTHSAASTISAGSGTIPAAR